MIRILICHVYLKNTFELSWNIQENWIVFPPLVQPDCRVALIQMSNFWTLLFTTLTTLTYSFIFSSTCHLAMAGMHKQRLTSSRSGRGQIWQTTYFLTYWRVVNKVHSHPSWKDGGGVEKRLIYAPTMTIDEAHARLRWYLMPRKAINSPTRQRLSAEALRNLLGLALKIDLGKKCVNDSPSLFLMS